MESSVPREIAPVVVTLNRLFSLLRSAVQSQQQFIANTAHHLRTLLLEPRVTTQHPLVKEYIDYVPTSTGDTVIRTSRSTP